MSSGGADSDSVSGDDQGDRSKISFFRLFSFAEKWDYFLMAVGSIGAFVHGASLPVFFIFFGKLLNEFAIASLSPAAVSHRVAKYSLYFVYLGVVTLFSAWAEVACWMQTGERGYKFKIRISWFSAGSRYRSI